MMTDETKYYLEKLLRKLRYYRDVDGPSDRVAYIKCRLLEDMIEEEGYQFCQSDDPDNDGYLVGICDLEYNVIIKDIDLGLDFRPYDEREDA